MAVIAVIDWVDFLPHYECGFGASSMDFKRSKEDFLYLRNEEGVGGYKDFR